MTETVLVLNAGSSSVKFQLFAYKKELPLLADGKVTAIGADAVFHAQSEETKGDTVTKNLPPKATHEDALRTIIDWVHNLSNGWRIAAVAHRIVHGGTEFTEPARITSDVFHRLKKLIPLAPLHQPHSLAAVGIANALLPHVPQIACFDTAFHARHDPLFTCFALPQAIADKGVRRYGFHGLSYEWIVQVLKEKHPQLAKGRIIAAHLGNGASLCAMQAGQSVDTTMGMTALDGLPMGTRAGALDAGAVIYMIRDLGLPPEKTEHILYEQSGLKGLSGMSGDVKILLESKDANARFALDYFALKVAQYIAMMAVSLGGVDGIVFTGGIGENASPVREAVMGRLAFLGSIPALVIPANEERVMAQQTLAFLSR
jgi:acetate kinase